MSLNSYESMAVAVLKGDWAAARALADHIVDEESKGVRLFPQKIIPITGKNIRVVCFVRNDSDQDDFEIDYRSLNTEIRRWLKGEEITVMALQHVERIEVYEIRTEPDVETRDGIPHKEDVR